MRALALLASLYICQGLPFGFFTQALPALLRREGLSLEAVGLSSLLALPWALKFLWAPLVDRCFWPRVGRRRSWLLPLQALSALALALASLLPPSRSLGAVLAAVAVINLLSATQDIATDGLAIDLLPEGQRGLANGVQVAGYRAGMIVGGGALLVVFERVGWQLSFLVMAALLVALSVPIWMHREAAGAATASATASASAAAAATATASATASATAAAAASATGAAAAAASAAASAAGAGTGAGGATAAVVGEGPFWRRPGAGGLLGLLIFYKLGEALAAGMLRPWLIDRGLGLAEIGWVLGTVGFTAGLVGALLGGGLSQRLGRRRSLVLFSALQAVAVGGYALVEMYGFSLRMLAVVCGVEHLASGMATAALFAAMMDWSSRETGAADYTVQASAVVAATGAAAALSGWSAARLGYGGHFALAAGLASLVPALARRLSR